MNIETGHLVKNINKIEDEEKKNYDKVPRSLADIADKMLDGKDEVYLDTDNKLRKEMTKYIKRNRKNKRKK